MSAFDQIGKARRTIKQALAKSLGVTIQFSHRGAANVPLNVRILSDRIETVAEAGALVERRVVTFEIPVQTGFPQATGEAEPVTGGDVIAYLSRDWSVLSPVDKDATGNVYTVRTVERKHISHGI